MKAETLRLYFHNVHCKQIIFGASSDNGFATCINSYSTDTKVSTQIRLLEGAPFSRDFQTIMSRFKRTKFPDVFRDEKLPSEAPPLSREPLSPSTRNTRFSSTSWRSKEEPEFYTPNLPPNAATSSSFSPEAADPELMTFGVYQNSKGQRVDIPPKLSFNAAIADNMKSREGDWRLCNYHHLVQRCTSRKCTRDHSSDLSEDELSTLTYMARNNRCSQGTDCTSAYCVYGHMCRNGANCPRKKCNFEDVEHNIDPRVATVIGSH